MISRFEYLYVKSKIKKIEDKLFEFENDPAGILYPKWGKWLALTDSKKQLLEQEWNLYYEQCRNGYWGQTYKRTNEATKRKDAETVKKLANEAKHSTVLELIKKPSSIDPSELRQKMEPYFLIQAKLAQLKKIQTEYEDVYEKKTLDGPGTLED